MELFVVLFILLCVWCLIPRKGGFKSRFYTKNYFKENNINEREFDYLDSKTNNCLRGIFGIGVLLGHLWQNNYFYHVRMNKYFINIAGSIGSASVGVFYILSSYGMIRSYIKARAKGSGLSYVKKIFTNKIPLLLMLFITANIIYILYDIIWAGGTYSFFDFIVKATSIDIYWTGLHTVMMNRYTWFVFVLIHLYILLGITLFIVEKLKSIRGERKALTVAIVMAVTLFIIQHLYKTLATGVAFEGTIIFVKAMTCFSFGIFYGIYNKQIHAFFRRWWWPLFSLFFAISMLDLFLPDRLFQTFVFRTLEIRYFFASIFVILIITKVNIKNVVAEHLGMLSFGIYFMQMLALTIVNNHITKPVDITFGIYATVLTVALAYAFTSVRYYYRKLFSIKAKKANLKP